jgi:rhodanese-related sulfurtransferase
MIDYSLRITGRLDLFLSSAHRKTSKNGLRQSGQASKPKFINMAKYLFSILALVVSASIVVSSFAPHQHQQQDPMFGRIAQSSQRILSSSAHRATTTARFMSRKAGVASPEELKAFVAEAGDRLLVVDVRNPDAEKEPGDQKSLVVASLPSADSRSNAVNLIWDRDVNAMPLPEESVAKDTPIITHCGGGGRGQKAKDFLQSNGFTKVLNGGGPKETECWAEFGDK